MGSWLALTLLLGAPAQVHLGPAHAIDDGVVLAPADRDGRAITDWMRAHLGTHPLTEFRARFMPRKQGGGVLLVREFYRGLPIAGSRMALRLDRAGRLRQVVGKAMRPGVTLGAASGAGATIWWPSESGLIPARLRDDAVRYVKGHPQQMRRAFALGDGRELAAWSILDEADVPIRGWREDPVTTPEGEDFMTEIFDASPLRLQNDFMRVMECNWSEAEETCDPIWGPSGSPVSGWTTDLPDLDDETAHADLYDVFPGVDWDVRARGLGATLERPASTVGEENLLHLPEDWYPTESIMVHEFSHTMWEVGVRTLPDGVQKQQELLAVYNAAIAAGLWDNTYAATDVREYWAETVQSWFNTNTEATPSDGVHNHVNTREELVEYDPDVVPLIDEVYVEDDWVVP